MTARPDAAAATRCYHCGLPVTHPGRWQVVIDGARRPMCCAGCEAVASTIVQAGLTDYYRHRGAPAAAAPDPDKALAELQRLGLYDDPEVQRTFVRPTGETMECTLAIEGMRCGACVWLLEKSLRDQPGVVAASVNFATERAVLAWDPKRARLSDLLTRVRAVGYQALPFDAHRHEADIQRASKALFRRMFIAGLGMMQVMMYAVPAYVAGADGIDAEHALLMRWASLLLTVPVVLYSAVPFYQGALRDLRNRRPGMDTPVTLGIVAAFAASVHATLRQHGEVYFDSVTMFVFLLLLARWLEWVARRRAGRAVDGLSASLPDSIERIEPDGSLRTVPATRAVPGERFLVATGERVALDARLVEGETAIDASLLTGESLPVARRAGDEIPGGAIVTGHPARLEVSRPLRDSAPSVMQRLIDRAAAEKPAVATAADRVAAWFVAGLLLLAAATWGVWMVIDPSRALPIAIAVLVVSCPCALSLATPAALAAATGTLLERGLLCTRGHALEALAEVTDVVFDKTGTLTEGRPAVVDVVDATDPVAPLDAVGRADPTPGAGSARERWLRIAAALEAGSNHPFALALRAAASAAPPPAIGLETHAGAGVVGAVDGVRYALGSEAFAIGEADATREPDRSPGEAGGDASREATTGDSVVWVSRLDGDVRVPLARILLRDALRADARAAIDRLRGQGLRLHLLSGDRPAAVASAACALGIDSWRGGASPQQKFAFVKSLQRDGRRVLMVGDGLNDAPVLAAADVSIAVSDASSLARVAADVVSVRPGVAQIERARTMARRTRAVIRQNLAWATVYNLLAIPAAALGWVPPWVAALGMSLSSLVVAGNAVRLWSWNRSTS